MSAPARSDRVLHSFIEDGPTNMTTHIGSVIGDEVRRTRQRGGLRNADRGAVRSRLVMLWPAAALLVVVAVAAAGGTDSTPEASAAPAAQAASAAPVASVAAVAPIAPVGSAAAAAAGDPTVTTEVAAQSKAGLAGDGTIAASATGSSADLAQAGWLAYTAGDRIRLVRQDGSEDQAILADIGLRQRGASWSRDGRLVFEADFGVASQLWVADPDAGTATPLTDIDLACSTACVFAGDATWNGDGSLIAYVRRTVARGMTASNALVVVPLADRVSRTLVTDARHLLRRPSWEPGGHRIVVERDGGPRAMRGEPSTAQLVIVDARDTTPTLTRVPGTGSDAHDPAWGGNGLIAYATARTGDQTNPGAGAGSALVTVDPDSGLSLTVLAFPAGAARVTDPAWWPDGEGLLYGRLAPRAVVPVIRTVNIRTRLEQSATGAETAVGFDPEPRRSAP